MRSRKFVPWLSVVSGKDKQMRGSLKDEMRTLDPLISGFPQTNCSLALTILATGCVVGAAFDKIRLNLHPTPPRKGVVPNYVQPANEQM